VQLSQEEYLNWLNDPVTKEVRKILRKRQEVLKESWVDGKWADGDDAYARGLANGILQMEVLDSEFE
jgi:hypothetical protein